MTKSNKENKANDDERATAKQKQKSVSKVT